MAGRWELTEEQWKLREPILRPARPEDKRARPWHDTRVVLNGVMWILGSGAQWAEMPSRYPPYQTCHRRFQQWIHEGKLVAALRLLALDLRERGKLKLDEAFVDATFASGKNGTLPSARPGAARAPRSSLSLLVMVFLSPYLSRALRLPSAGWWKLFWPDASSTSYPALVPGARPQQHPPVTLISGKISALANCIPSLAGNPWPIDSGKNRLF